MIQPWDCCYTCGKVKAEHSEVLLRDIAGNTVETVHKLLTCTRCYTNLYCSKECQQTDWAKHKSFCVKSKSVLPKQILKHLILSNYETVVQPNIHMGRTVPFESGYLMTEITRTREGNELELNIESESTMHLKSELDERIAGKWVEISEGAKGRLNELKALSVTHPDKLLVDIEFEEPTVNFMFRLCEKISFQELVENIDINRATPSILISLYLRESKNNREKYDLLSTEGQKVVQKIVFCIELLRFIKLKFYEGISKFQGSKLREFGFSGVDKITFSTEGLRDLFLETGDQTSSAFLSIEKEEAEKALEFASQICTKTLQPHSCKATTRIIELAAVASLQTLTHDLETFWQGPQTHPF